MKKFFFTIFLFSSLLLNVWLCAAGFNPLPDTGQTKCYDNEEEINCPSPGENFYGQDGNYQGVQQNFTVKEINGDKVVVDENTGLMWVQKSTGDADGDGSVTNYDKFTWQEAIDYCEGLNYAGYNDWRLPSIFELSTIVNYEMYNSAIDEDIFDCKPSNYWSSTPDSSFPDYAWSFYFYFGTKESVNKSYDYYIRCVRGVVSNADKFESMNINNDKVVKDNSTGLMWMQSTADLDNNGTIDSSGDSDRATWENALKYCEDLEYAGYSDWRLPNIQELRSIINYENYQPTIDTAIFSCESSYYWASTTYLIQNDRAGYVNFNYATDDWAAKSDYLYVRCVRGGLSAPVDNCDSNNLSNCTTESKCTDAGGYWYGSECNTNPQAVCDTNNLNLCTTESQCAGIGKYWYDNKCNAEPKCTVNNLSACDTETKCTDIGKYWYNNKCNSEPDTSQEVCDVNHLNLCNTEALCQSINKFWYNNQCNASPQPVCDVNHLDLCNTESLCTGIGKYWYDNKCNASPQNIGGECTFPKGTPILKPLDSCNFKDKYDIGEEVTFELKYNTGFKILELPVEKDNCKISNNDVVLFNPLLQKLSFISDGIAEITCVYNNKVAREQFFVGNFINQPKNAIIVVGKAKENDALKPTFEYIGNRVYNYLKSQSYSDEDIIYFNAFDNSSGFADKTDFKEDDILNIIKSMPNSSVPLLIYLIDHGTKLGTILLNGNFNQLMAVHLKSALDEFQKNSNRPVIVVIDSCYSGKFVEILKGANRVIIASSKALEKALMTSGGISFSNYFIKNLQNKLSIEESFNKAKLKYKNIVKNTTPVIEGSAGLLNKPFGFLYSASGDVIENFTGKQALKLSNPKEIDLILTAKNLIGINDSTVYAILTPPQTVIDSGDNVILAKSDKVLLNYNAATGKFGGKYNFSKEGIYVVQYEVTDGAGDKYISDSVEIQVGDSTKGVEIVSDNGTTSELSIKTGWSLKALPVDIEDGLGVKVFNESGINTLWKWSGSSWEIWSPLSSIIELLTKYNINEVSKINTGEGFWVNATENVSVNVGEGDEYGIEKISIKSGWNLVGVGKEVVSTDFETLGSIKTLWKWSGSSWQIWSPIDSIMNIINNYGLTSIEKLEKGEGFWINK